MRERLPETRTGHTKHFKVSWPKGETIKVYITANIYEDGRLGELFITADRSGRLVRGMLDGASIALSVALQHGVPMRAITDKWRGMRFEPDGYTGDREIKKCTSILDFVARWLELRFPEKP